MDWFVVASSAIIVVLVLMVFWMRIKGKKEGVETKDLQDKVMEVAKDLQEPKKNGIDHTEKDVYEKI